MTDSVKRTLRPLDRQIASRRAIPDIPQGASIDVPTMRNILVAVKERLDQMSGDGPESVMTLRRAVETGIVVPKPRPDGGGNNAANPFDPQTGYGAPVWGGHIVPPAPSDTFATPGDVVDLEVFAGFGGVYLSWSAPTRTGGFFRIWRAQENDRSKAIEIAGRVSSLMFFDSTAQVFDEEGNAVGADYYYWVQNYTVPPQNSTLTTPRFGAWSSGEFHGKHWELDPNTFARLTADNILAGRLKVVLDLDVGGAIRSGKELLEDGTVSTAAGFFINGNYFYFGSENDESYIKWNGSELLISGTLNSSYINGAVINGGVIAGTWIFGDRFIYDRAVSTAGQAYQNDYSLRPGAGQYEVTYLVRNEVLTDTTSSEIVDTRFGFTDRATVKYVEYVDEVTLSPSFFDSPVSPFSIPLPYDCPSSATTNRCVDEDSLTLSVVVLSNMFGCETVWASPLYTIVVERTYYSYDTVNGFVFDRTVTQSFTAGSGSASLEAGDPLYPGTYTFTGDVANLEPTYSGSTWYRIPTTYIDSADVRVTNDSYTFPSYFNARWGNTQQYTHLFKLTGHSGYLKKLRITLRGVIGGPSAPAPQVGGSDYCAATVTISYSCDNTQ